MPTSPRSEPRWRAVLGIGMLVGLLAFVLWPKALNKLGVFDYGMWFLDSYAILAASDTRQAGVDPVQPMAFDIQHRAHIYSDWWYGVGQLGLTRDDNFLLGGLWVLAFVLATWIFLRPKSGWETAWYLCLFISPPVLLAVNRANNDLVIFVLLVFAALVLARQALPHIAAAIAALAVATGLKYYPIVGGAVFLLVRPRSRLIATLVAAAVVLGAVMASVGAALGRANLNGISVSIYTFGAPVILRDLGWEGPRALVAGVVIMAVLVGASIFWRGLRVMDGAKSPATQAAFVLGAAMLVGCFLTGISFAYRCAFLLLVAPWLWEQRTLRTDAKWAVWLTAAVLWLDGLSCLVMNFLVGPVNRAVIPTIQLGWRFATQPVAWILMVLLIRWLLEIALAAWRAESVGQTAPLSTPVQP
jgi:hypothetical protein